MMLRKAACQLLHPVVSGSKECKLISIVLSESTVISSVLSEYNNDIRIPMTSRCGLTQLGDVRLVLDSYRELL